MRLRPLVFSGAALAFALGLAAPSGAVTLGFGCITDNLAGDCAIGEAQLQIDVSDPGGGKIDFTFRNAGPEASSITDIYWDDDALLKLFSIYDTPGHVEFAKGANPSNVPGANHASPRFRTSWGLSIDSDSPVQHMGVNPGESVRVTFLLVGGHSFANAIEDLGDGSLRIAIHVQGYESCGSESFVNDEGPVPVPEPGTFALVAGGLFSFARTRRQRR